MTTKWLLLVGIFVAVLGIAAIACDDDPSEAELTIELCRDLVDLQVADAAFDTLDENSTLDEIKSVNIAYGDALDDVIDSAGDLADVRSEPVEAAYNDLNQAIADIPGDATIIEALTSIEDELVAIDNAYATAFSSLGC